VVRQSGPPSFFRFEGCRPQTGVNRGQPSGRFAAVAGKSESNSLFPEFGLSQIVANFAEEGSEIENLDHAKWKRGTAMPDGSRKRRHSANCVKKQWYAHHRAIRFSRRFLGVASA
jgi:hypothetical protein